MAVRTSPSWGRLAGRWYGRGGDLWFDRTQRRPHRSGTHRSVGLSSSAASRSTARAPVVGATQRGAGRHELPLRRACGDVLHEPEDRSGGCDPHSPLPLSGRRDAARRCIPRREAGPAAVGRARPCGPGRLRRGRPAQHPRVHRRSWVPARACHRCDQCTYTLAGRVLLRGSTAGHIGWRPAAVQRPHHSVYLRRRPGRPAEGVTVGRPQGRWPVAVSLLAWAASDEAVLDLAAGLAVSCAA